MNPFSLLALSMEPFRLWSTLAWKTGEMMLGSARVIGYRTNSNSSAPGSTGSRELALMGTEKIAAATESSQAMVFGWMRLNQEMTSLAVRQMLAGSTALISIAASRTPQQAVDRQTRFVRDSLHQSAAGAVQLSGSAARGAQRALKPIQSRVSGNVRRLSKR